MAIITISRGTFSGGQALAECVAEKLGYRCLSRYGVLVQAAEQYRVPLEKLSEALSEAPGFLERMTVDWYHDIAFVRAALCRAVKDDNVVWHGLAGHMLIRGLPHLVRVRVVANTEFRIAGAMQRNSRLKKEEAIEYIKKMDEKRVKWTRFLYHVDWHDPSLYDLVVNIDRLNISDVCQIVSHTAGLERFKTTPAAQKAMNDLLLGAEVRAEIAMDRGIAGLGVEVEADGGVITLGGMARSLEEADRIREMVRKAPGVREVKSKMSVSHHW